jgi:hypothetical protein
MENTTARLNDILASIEDAPLRDELFNSFFVLNPLDVAQLLHSLEIPDAVKAKILALKIGMPTPYKGTDLSPLIEKAMQQMWAKLGTA